MRAFITNFINLYATLEFSPSKSVKTLLNVQLKVFALNNLVNIFSSAGKLF